MNLITEYVYPDDSDPEVKKVKGLASRIARAERKMCNPTEKTVKIRRQLRDYMSTLKWSRLFYWRDILMIDPRWCGATGAGAYIAVASRIVNETARAILKENPAPSFWVE